MILLGFKFFWQILMFNFVRFWFFFILLIFFYVYFVGLIRLRVLMMSFKKMIMKSAQFSSTDFFLFYSSLRCFILFGWLDQGFWWCGLIWWWRSPPNLKSDFFFLLFLFFFLIIVLFLLFMDTVYCINYIRYGYGIFFQLLL